MHQKMVVVLGAALVISSLGLSAPVSVAADKPEKTSTKDCDMTFSLRGWSAIYKTAKGEGTVTCDNGQSAKVSIKMHGGGLTFGKSKIVNGRGEFSGVKSIDEIFGAYATGEAHAGVVKSATAQIMTKGDVSLALSGTGHGVDVGIDFGKFTIKRVM